MVGGSRYNGLWATVDRVVKEMHEAKSDKVLVVNTLTKESAIERLLLRLDGVSKSAKKHGIYLAVSMEPGPLFAIGDWDSLALFCDKIESSSESIRSNVGLNLDIPHWAFLSNITIRKVEGNPNVKNRIVHAQISDHNRGHCSDAILGTFHDSEEYLPWLSLLKKLAANITIPNKTCLPYSGFISCEHEMACKTEIITRSVGKLKRLLSRCKSSDW